MRIVSPPRGQDRLGEIPREDAFPVQAKLLDEAIDAAMQNLLRMGLMQEFGQGVS
jgi:hypothetical protein